MTTITLDEDIKISKTNFKNHKEMITFFIENTSYDFIDFKEMSYSEISEDIFNKFKNSQKKDLSEFDNI